MCDVLFIIQNKQTKKNKKIISIEKETIQVLEEDSSGLNAGPESFVTSRRGVPSQPPLS